MLIPNHSFEAGLEHWDAWRPDGQACGNAVSVSAATYGVDGQGRDTAYVVVDGSEGYEAHLVGILMDTGEVTVDLSITGGLGAWNATTASNGKIYVGTYNYLDTTKLGRLYEYTQGAGQLVDLGQGIPGDSFVWDVTAGPDGAIYGGGYPSGGIFRWSPDAGFSQIGPRQVVAPQQYVRSIAYDPSLDLVYGGIGSHAHLAACSGTGTAPCTEILPKAYRSFAFTYDLAAGDHYLFVRMENGGRSLVLKVNKDNNGVTAQPVADLGAVDHPGAAGPVDGKFYYTKVGVLHSYDVASGAETALGATNNGPARRWSVVRLADQTDWPGHTLVGANSSGAVYRYNLDTGHSARSPKPTLPGVPTSINRLIAGPDGKIYTDGYLYGGFGVHTPMRSDLDVEYSGVGQAEGMTVLGDTMYLGIYPHAVVQSYRPSEPWSPGTNPKQVCSLQEADQDRPYAMLGAPDGKIYMGSMAAYGKLPGALSIYDPATGDCTSHVGIVPDQTITSLTYTAGKVYGGSMIWGGLGIEPTATEAKLFSYDHKPAPPRSTTCLCRACAASSR